MPVDLALPFVREVAVANLANDLHACAAHSFVYSQAQLSWKDKNCVRVRAEAAGRTYTVHGRHQAWVLRSLTGASNCIRFCHCRHRCFSFTSYALPRYQSWKRNTNARSVFRFVAPFNLHIYIYVRGHISYLGLNQLSTFQVCVRVWGRRGWGGVCLVSWLGDGWVWTALLDHWRS